jgi:hypothetical protein
MKDAMPHTEPDQGMFGPTLGQAQLLVSPVNLALTL